MTKKCFAMILAVVMTLSLLTGCAPKGSGDKDPKKGGIDKEEIIIGVSSAFSGWAQYLGFTGKVGIDLAVEDINSKGGINGIPVRVVYRDDEQDATECMTNVQDLVINESIDIFIGPTSSTAAMAIAEFLNEEKILNFNGGCTGSGLDDPTVYPYTFRTMINNEIQTQFIIEYAMMKGYTKFALCNATDAVGVTAREGLMSALKEKNVKPVVDVSYNSGDVDMLSVAQRIAEGEPEIVLFGGGGADVAHIVNSMKQIGFTDCEMIGYTGVLVTTFNEIAGDMAQKVTGVNILNFTYAGDDDGFDTQRNFAARCFNACKNDGEKQMLIVATAASWYDCAIIIADAIEKTNSLDGDVLKAFLENNYIHEGMYITAKFSAEDHEGMDVTDLCLSPADTSLLKNEFQFPRVYP